MNREDAWEELRREIEALPGKAILFGDGGFAVRTEYDNGWVSRAAVLAIVDRLAAARGEPPGPIELEPSDYPRRQYPRRQP